MVSYESGLLLAFLLWLWAVVNALVLINSRMETNLNRIGQRLSWLTLTPKAMSAEDSIRSPFRKAVKFSLIFGAGLPFVLASWLYVAVVAGTVIYRRSKDAGAPQAVREFRWKLKNTDMSFDQLIKELMKVSDQDPADFEKFKSTMLHELGERGIRDG